MFKNSEKNKINNKLKFFLISVLAVYPFFLGINDFQKDLENILFQEKVTAYLIAKASYDLELEKLKPIKKNQYENLEIDVKSAISFFIKNDGSEKILFEKNKDKSLPIASIAKLMTANIVLKNYQPSHLIKITPEAINTERSLSNLNVDDTFLVNDLLHLLLIESSNQAAIALANEIGMNAFVKLMNFEAKKIGLENTYFFNPTGLDPDPDFNEKNSQINHSTSYDLVKLARFLLKEKPAIFDISILPQFSFYSKNGIFYQTFNTNRLLNLNDFSNIIGGKTGWTIKSQDCLILIIKSPENKGIIINVILGASDRFEEMKKLINWLKISYKW